MNQMDKNRINNAENEELEEKKSSSLWEGVILGGIPGIVLGAAGSMVAQGFVPAPGPTPNGEIPVAQTPNDDMSFREAFEAARAEVGPGGAFIWHGNVYSTYRSDDPEWIAMGPEGQAEHCHDIMMQVHPEPYSAHDDDDQTVDDPHDTDDTEHIDDTDNRIEEPEPLEADVHITEIDTDPGTGETAAIGEVDGVMTVFIDENGDGVVDTILHDDDGSGNFTSNEQYSAENSGITIGDLAEQMDPGEDVTLYEDQPDYTTEDTSDYENRADVEGF